MSMDENIRASIKSDMQFSLDVTEEVVKDMKVSKERYRQLYATLYWLSVKMSNRQGVFQKKEIQAVEQLCLFAEEMIIYIEEIIKMAEEVQKDMKIFLQKELNGSEYPYRCIEVLKKKAEIFHICYRQYTREQQNYTKYMMIVKEILERSDFPKQTIWEKIEHMFVLGK